MKKSNAQQKSKNTSVKARMKKTISKKAALKNKNVVREVFKAGDHVNYPAHGIGMIMGVETLTVGGMEATLYSINFEKDRMRVKIPMERAMAAGLRKLSSPDQLADAIATLQGRARVRRVMWSRRAAEYDAKVNSGDPVLVAEVLRDLKRCAVDEEQSYSERQVYQGALERLGREVAAIESLSQEDAEAKLEDILRGAKKKKSADIVEMPIKSKTNAPANTAPMPQDMVEEKKAA